MRHPMWEPVNKFFWGMGLRLRPGEEASPHCPTPLFGGACPETTSFPNQNRKWLTLPLSTAQPLSHLSMSRSSVLRWQSGSGTRVHLRNFGGHFCGYRQPLGGHVGAHPCCPLRLLLAVGFHGQLLQPAGSNSAGVKNCPRHLTCPSCTYPAALFLLLPTFSCGLWIGNGPSGWQNR